MTSKSSFFKIVKQQHKNLFWYPLIIFVYFFIILEVQFLMRVQDIERWPARFKYNKVHYFANLFLSIDKNLCMTVSVCALGCISALLLFSYVQSRNKLDLIHSLPVKRGTIYWANYVTGVSFFCVPVFVHSFFILALASAKGCMSMHGFIDYFAFMGCELLFYLLTYSMTVVAIMLTGNFVVGILATVVLQSYSYLIGMLKNELYYEFFRSAVRGKVKPVFAFSPIDMIVKICTKMSTYRRSNSGISYQSVFGYAFVLLAAVVILGVLAYFLYRYRKTEAAGRAIAFPVVEPVIKCLLCIPVSLEVGYLFSEVASANPFPWMVFGMVFCFILFCLVMEMIFRMNIREGLKHWHHIIFNGVCTCLILVILKTDVLGYNTYVPSMEEISHIAVSLEDAMYISRWGDMSYEDMDISNYRLKHVKLEDQETYAFVSSLAKEQLHYPDEGNSAVTYDVANGKESRNYHEITVCYYLKNGKEVYRKYLYDYARDEHKNEVARIFNSREYKLGSIPLLQEGWNLDIDRLNCEGLFMEDSFQLSENQKNELLNAYQSDIMNLTFDELVHKRPIYVMEFNYNMKNGAQGYEDGYRVYESFTKTRKCLETIGITDDWNQMPEKINSVTITYYNYEEDKDDFPSITVTEQDKMLEVIQNAVSYAMMRGGLFVSNEHELDIDVEFINEKGEKHYKYMTFFNNQVPQFVLDEFGF